MSLRLWRSRRFTPFFICIFLIFEQALEKTGLFIL